VIAEQAERIAELERLEQFVVAAEFGSASPSRVSLRGKAGRRTVSSGGRAGWGAAAGSTTRTRWSSTCRTRVPAVARAWTRADDVGVVCGEVHDIPQVTTTVTEHRLFKLIADVTGAGCSTGWMTTCPAPAAAQPPMSSGCCPGTPVSPCTTHCRYMTTRSTRPRHTLCAVRIWPANWSPAPKPTPAKPG
jgi:hypothetical protein